MERNLNIDTAVTLGNLLRVAQGNQPVTRYIEDLDRTVSGTARAITRDNGVFLGRDDDVRDAFLWVTLDSGFEAFWPVADLLVDISNGDMALNYRV